MQEELITFETAKLAKLKGFDWKVIYYYNHKDFIFDDGLNYCNYNQKELITKSAPTQSLLQKWLREVYNINVWVSSKTTDKDNTIYIPHGRTIPDTIVKGLVKDVIVYKTFYKWEEAFEFGLQEALKLIEIAQEKS